MDYGLIDFFGVLARPIMRPVFKAPGLSAVIAVSAIIFLGAFVPCIMSTSIRVSLFELIVNWFERIVITILITGVVAMLYF